MDRVYYPLLICSLFEYYPLICINLFLGVGSFPQLISILFNKLNYLVVLLLFLNLPKIAFIETVFQQGIFTIGIEGFF